jgi:putative transcriptional regulator
MPYTPIAIDREALTIMGVAFPDLEALESTADAIGSNMFEGYQPTPKGIEIIRDYITGKMAFTEFIRAAMDKSYEK